DVECRERFVEHQQLRIEHEGASERHAALHASRKLVRKAAEVDRRESQPEREFTSATLAFVARHTNGGQAERDVVERRLPRQQARLLEHEGLRGETVLEDRK